MELAGDLQHAWGLWDDFDENLRNTARAYVGQLGAHGLFDTIPGRSPGTWTGLRIILGNAICDRLRVNADIGEKDKD